MHCVIINMSTDGYFGVFQMFAISSLLETLALFFLITWFICLVDEIKL